MEKNEYKKLETIDFSFQLPPLEKKLFVCIYIYTHGVLSWHGKDAVSLSLLLQRYNFCMNTFLLLFSASMAG